MAKIEEHRKQDKLNAIRQKAEVYGHDSLEPCEACHLSTGCLKCCESCREVNEECGMAQQCGRKIKLNAGKWELVETDDNGDETYQTGRGGYKSYLNFTIKATVSKDMTGRYCGTYCVEEPGRTVKWEFFPGTYDTKEDALRAVAVEVAKTGTTKAAVLKDNGYIDEIPVEAIAADEEMREQQREEKAQIKAKEREANEAELNAVTAIRDVLKELMRDLQKEEGRSGNDPLIVRLGKEVARYEIEIEWREGRKEAL